MVLGSSIYGAGGTIPQGDQLRSGQTTVNGSTQTTILTVASGGGVVYGFWLKDTEGGTQTLTLDVTIDGASERTLSNYIPSHTSTSGDFFWVECPINFGDSCTVKATTGRNSQTNIVYSLK